jgi:predicted secreted protein
MESSGRDFKVQVLIAGTWYDVPGERSSGATINNEQVDTTEKGVVPWRELSAFGIRSGEIVCSGVVRDNPDPVSVFGFLMLAAMNGGLVEVRVITEPRDVIAQGFYLLTTLERNGEYNGAEMFSLSFSSATAAASGPLPFVLRINTEQVTPGAATFILPLSPSASFVYNFMVDWGDGTVEGITNASAGFPSILHIYPVAGVYDVTITPTGPSGSGFPTLVFNDGGDKLKVLEIKAWGGVVWESFYYAFAGCANMQITAIDSANAQTGGVRSWWSMFYRCYGLTSVPHLDMSGGVEFNSLFNACSSLTSIPSTLNWSNGTNFNFVCNGCTVLQSMPVLDVSKGTSFQGAWQGCAALTSFPLLNFAEGANFHSAWRDCVGLTSFPAMAFPKATTFIVTWSGCTGLVSFGLITFGPTLVAMDQSWLNCSGLTSFPALDTKDVTNFNSAWRNCVDLNGYAFPLLNMRKMSVGTNAFNGTKIATAAWSALLIDLAAGAVNNSVSFHGGTANYDIATAGAARTYLTTSIGGGGKGWTIVDGGGV